MAKEWMDEIVYNEALVSPGYKVEAAIGTTYSLDLEALLEVPIALGELTASAEQYLQKPHYLLDILSQVSEKFCIFCNAGSIYSPIKDKDGEQLPNNALIGERVLTLLEDCVFPIQLPARKNSFISFHPKVWVILETDRKGKSQLKVMIMSRNLTYSTDIDAVCIMTGKVKKSKASLSARTKHKPLYDFVAWLGNQKPTNRKKNQLTSILCDAIECVESFDIDNPLFDDYNFYPMGIEGYSGLDCLNDMTSASGDAVIVSPFVDETTIAAFANRTGRKTLFTQPNSCTPQILALLPNEVYATKITLSDPGDDEDIVNVHEKLYFINQGSHNRLFLGSTNATQNGFNGNVEFLIGLQFSSYMASYNKMMEQLLSDDKDCPFEKALPYTPQMEEILRQRAIQLALRQATASLQRGIVESNGETYSITISCKDIHSEKTFYIYPIYTPTQRQVLQNTTKFEGLNLVDLTELFILECDDVKSVVKIPLKDLPCDQRKQAISTNLLNSAEKIIDYLSYMLSSDPDGYLEEILQNNEDKTSSSKHNNLFWGLSLYEDLLKMVYTNPDKIRRASETLNRCAEQKDIAGLKQLLNQIQQSIPKIKRLKQQA